MKSILTAELVGVERIVNGDPIAITFFLGYMAMFASAVFFFAERSSVDRKWKASLLVSGLITGIAAVHYYYMRDFYMITGSSPTSFRFVLLFFVMVSLISAPHIFVMHHFFEAGRSQN
nr:bacteriorhodopsin [Arthrospiribacter ruber]